MIARRSLFAAVVVLLVCASGAAPAGASTAGVSGSTLSITGGGGERNRLSVTVSGSDLLVSDSGATLRPGAGCTQSGSAVRCPSAGLTEIVADAGDRPRPRDDLAVGDAALARARWDLATTR